MHLRYDLHLHSCLSPCANNDMTPATIVGMAKLAGVEVVAVTDHNCAKNLPFVKIACAAYGIKMIAGIEVTTAEEIHILCYLPSVEAALALGEILYNSLPDILCDKEVYGEQLVCDCDDSFCEEIPKLLTNATTFDIYEVFALAKKYGGIAIPAHIDKDSYSAISVLGIMPEDLPVAGVELRHPKKLDILVARGQIEPPSEIFSSSDAHILEDIANKEFYIDEQSCLWQFVI